MNRHDVRLVVITGAGGGIGRASAQRFARSGARVIVSDINGTAAKETAALIDAEGGDAHARVLDVTDAAAFEAFAQWVHDEHGVGDVVVNNAGIGIAGEVIDTTEADWDRIIGINLLGVVHGARLFAQQMIAAKKPGHIVNVASAAAFLPMQNLASYSTTKAAVKMLSDCLRAELAPDRIGVSAICPGIIKTNIFAAATHSAVGDADAAHRSRLADAATDRLRSLKLISGPDKVARAIEKSVYRNRGTVLVRPEAYGVYVLRRLAPSVLRTLSSIGSRSQTINIGVRLGGWAPVAKLIGMQPK